ncbi:MULTISPECIES: NUDIX domain-containing protein [unclassified Streptomyces]|uniref:NUDIX domain-containing protein n=1 Tax=unclassified Streptomyces TaxID=2593676 RepID=UPI0033FC1C8A
MTAPLTTQPVRHRRICDVHLVLIRDSHVLLTRRKGGYAAGLWQVPSGHLEPDEPTDTGSVREGWEEVGVRVDEHQLDFAHFIDHRAPGEEPRLGVFYRARTWHGEPYNAEPAKCDGLDWFPLHTIPPTPFPTTPQPSTTSPQAACAPNSAGTPTPPPEHPGERGHAPDSQQPAWRPLKRPNACRRAASLFCRHVDETQSGGPDACAGDPERSDDELAEHACSPSLRGGGPSWSPGA